MTREAKVWALTTTVLVGLIAAVAFHYRSDLHGGFGYPYNTFLFRPEDRGNDFYNIYRPVQIGHPYGAPTSVYFPFTYIPLYLVRFLDARSALTILVGLFTWSLSRNAAPAASVLNAGARNLVTIILTLCTYPYLFCVDRGNVEMMVFLLLAGFLSAVRKDRPYLAAVLLGAAAAMKGYPAMFGLILLSRRRFGAVAVSILCCGALTIGSASLYPGGVTGTFEKLQHHLATFNTDYITPTGPDHFNAGGMQHNASAMGFVRTLEMIGVIPPWAVTIFESYYVILALLAGLALSVWLLYERTLWKQLSVIVSAVILLPHISFDYKLILLLLPALLFLQEERQGRLDRAWVAAFGLLLIPKSYYWLKGDITISVLITPLLLGLLIALAMLERLISRNEAGQS